LREYTPHATPHPAIQHYDPEYAGQKAAGRTTQSTGMTFLVRVT
jgi:hypothetical protein